MQGFRFRELLKMVSFAPQIKSTIELMHLKKHIVRIMYVAMFLLVQCDAYAYELGMSFHFDHLVQTRETTEMCMFDSADDVDVHAVWSDLAYRSRQSNAYRYIHATFPAFILFILSSLLCVPVPHGCSSVTFGELLQPGAQHVLFCSFLI